MNDIEKPKKPMIKAIGKGLAIEPEPLMEAFGTKNLVFAEGVLKQIAIMDPDTEAVDETATLFNAAIISGINPDNEIEAMLAAQMTAVHNATMTLARRLAKVNSVPLQDSTARAFNQLTRTFVTQVEALQKLRNGGKQTVIVKHVTVNEGGQAVVGNIARGEGQ